MHTTVRHQHRRPLPRHPVEIVHQSAAGLAGVGLITFGVAGELLAMSVGTTAGAVIGGVFTNATLSALSVLTGTVLLIASLTGARAASNALVVTGPAFVASGLANAVLIGTPLNMIGFQASDVVFSLLVGAVLLLVGSYGRFTGALPDDGPYARTATRPIDRHAPTVDRHAARELAETERHVAAGVATTDEVTGVAAASCHRTHAARVSAFTAARGPVMPTVIEP